MAEGSVAFGAPPAQPPDVALPVTGFMRQQRTGGGISRGLCRIYVDGGSYTLQNGCIEKWAL